MNGFCRCSLGSAIDLREEKKSMCKAYKSIVQKNVWHISASFFCHQLIENLWLFLLNPSVKVAKQFTPIFY